MRMRASLLAAVLLLAAVSSPAIGADDGLDDLLKELARAKEPSVRVGVARLLAARGGSRAAGVLAKLVKSDPHPDVRTEAALALGRIKADNALELLLELLPDGGIHPVRDALARAIALRNGGADALALLDHTRTDLLGRGLLVEALGEFRDPATLHRLLTLSVSTEKLLRIEALRALSRRGQAEEEFLSAMLAVLMKSRNTALLMGVLDLVEKHPEPALIPGVRRALTFPEPAIRNAADHALAHLLYEERKRAGVVAAKDGYAPPGTPRKPPEDRPRFDLVFALDATGSVAGKLPVLRKRIADRALFLESMGADLRVGIVVFRGHRRAGEGQVLPLTHELPAVLTFLESLETGGTDSGGAAIYLGLTEGLDRMGWRWNARRSVFLFADSKCHDPSRSRAIASIHLAADRTRVNVLYLLRTRHEVPESILELARIGGGVVEIIE
jgi:HEAT repeat protein